MTRSLRWVLSLAVLLAAGCARDGATPAEPSVPAFGPDDLVLQVERVGGFRVAGFDEVPPLSIYGDGRVLTLGPQIEIYPPPALPNIQQATISQADVERLVRRAESAGVGEKLDVGQPPIADAPTTRFRLRTQSGVRTTEVYALRETDSGSGLTAEQAANRQRLVELMNALEDLRTTLGADAVSPDRPYAATAVAGLAHGWSADPQLPQKEMAWPGPALPGTPVPDSPYSCVTATGEQAQAVLSAAAQANTLTPWTSGGKKWLVQIRPLLPDETDCASLSQ